MLPVTNTRSRSSAVAYEDIHVSDDAPTLPQFFARSGEAAQRAACQRQHRDTAEKGAKCDLALARVA
ncbi:MAG: hypothetical protein DCC58_10840 [Chloroflexi bacterium]|nr:MAG: hypothetical protein DCC58_10840 [Chloroflexota bacterium]